MIRHVADTGMVLHGELFRSDAGNNAAAPFFLRAMTGVEQIALRYLRHVENGAVFKYNQFSQSRASYL